jgi:fructokinase
MKPGCIVGVGEILWDVFPDRACFGGAPANFACSAAELAGDMADVFMIGAVGRDELGAKSIESLASHGVRTAAVEINDHPTGRVIVQLDQSGQPTYTFENDTAWDNLAWTAAVREVAARASLLCFGTLGQRSTVSRRTIRQIVAATQPDCVRVLDINLRPPFWTDEVILESLPLANVLKLNDAELPVLARLLALSGSQIEQLRQLQNRYKLRLVALTRGESGSVLLDEHGNPDEQPGRSVIVADTVGAGDAFTAALAVGLLQQRPLNEVHRRAADIAAFVCSQPGATPKLPTV